MSEKKVFSFYDSKAEYYSPPYTAMTTADGIRFFAASAQNKQSNIGQYPADFTLFEIGVWNDLTAVFKGYEAKKSLGLALDFVQAMAERDDKQVNQELRSV